MKRFMLVFAIVLGFASVSEAGPVCNVARGVVNVVQKVRPVRRAAGFVRRLQPVRRVVRGGVRVVRGTASAVRAGGCRCN